MFASTLYFQRSSVSPSFSSSAGDNVHFYRHDFPWLSDFICSYMMWAGNTFGKREHRILVSLWVLFSRDIRMARMGLSPLRKAHALPRAAEATLCWTSIPDAFLASSVDRCMPCRQVDQSLQHGCEISVLLRLNPPVLLPSFLLTRGSTAPWSPSTKLDFWSV